MSFIFETPKDKQTKIAMRFRDLRVLKNLKRSTLAERAGVSESAIKRFETSGEISLRSLLMLAHVLDALDDFDLIFIPPAAKSLAEIQRREERLKPRSKKRGRL